jgi:hypothetical protein
MARKYGLKYAPHRAYNAHDTGVSTEKIKHAEVIALNGKEKFV